MIQPTQPETNLEAWLWATPNSNRVSVMFEELGLVYAVHGVNIRRGEQRGPEVVALNPYGKVPIVRWLDAGGEHVLFESGAILLDFAARHGRFLPARGAGREAVMTWLMVALTGLGPMMGQAHHWTALAPVRPPEAVQHSVSLVRRIYGVLDARLAAVPYLGGDDYSVADIAAFPWIARTDWADLQLGDWPALAAWHDRVAARPAVHAGMAVPRGARLEG